jgi:hypothetical protein
LTRIEPARRKAMKTLIFAALLALGASSIATVPSQSASVTITTRDDDRWDNGRHLGWWKGKHRGWYRNQDCEVRRRVIWRDGVRIVRTVRECR